MLLAKYHGEVGRVVQEHVGCVIVEFPDGDRYRLLRGIPGLELIEHKGRGRPRLYEDNAGRQRAYRQRKALQKDDLIDQDN
jgi:hypothetical protein